MLPGLEDLWFGQLAFRSSQTENVKIVITIPQLSISLHAKSSKVSHLPSKGCHDSESHCPIDVGDNGLHVA